MSLTLPAIGSGDPSGGRDRRLLVMKNEIVEVVVKLPAPRSHSLPTHLSPCPPITGTTASGTRPALRQWLKWGAVQPVRNSKVSTLVFQDPFPNNPDSLPLIIRTVVGQAFGLCPPLLFLHRAKSGLQPLLKPRQARDPGDPQSGWWHLGTTGSHHAACLRISTAPILF